MKPYKFAHSITDEKFDIPPYIYPNVWELQQTTAFQRLVIAPEKDHIDLIIELSRQLSEPFWVLYVLLVPRAKSADAGRYQSSQSCNRQELEVFLNRFRDYFEGDARMHLWLFSGEASQIIYDNHNVIYAYGPLDTFKSVLKSNNISEGEVIFPYPHMHRYNSEFDEQERQIMDYWEWVYFPLDEDED